MVSDKLYCMYGGRQCRIYTISNGDVEVGVVDFGAMINFIKVGGTDITLGYKNIDDYMRYGGYIGATVGRVANRIADGKFSLGGKTYTLSCNDGKNHLHCGSVGFDRKMFEVADKTDNSVTFKCVSADGEEGYPGKLELTVKFTVDGNALAIDFTAISDKDTLWCPTNHAYFNFDGEAVGDTCDNVLYINADKYTPVGPGLIPTGEKRSVFGTPFDFTVPKRIGKDYGCSELSATNDGYDHNYILNGEYAACAESAKTGISMKLYTDMPCVQFYSSGSMGNSEGKTGVYGKWYGFCLEPQYAPNAINTDGFEKPILKAGESKSHYIRYEFSRK